MNKQNKHIVSWLYGYQEEGSLLVTNSLMPVGFFIMQA